MEKKERVICSKCGKPITKVIYSKKANHYYHYRGKNTPCSLKTDVITPDMEIVETKKKRDTDLVETRNNQRSKKQIKEKDNDREEESRLPISDEIKEKEGILDMDILPQERPSYEILEEILRTYKANEKIIKLIIRKCARRELTPDEVEYNLTQLGLRMNEAEWIADEYNDALKEEDEMRAEAKKPRPRSREVIREDEGRPRRGRFQESDNEIHPSRGYNGGESRRTSHYSNDSATLTKENIRKMIEDTILKRDKEEKIKDLSNSINDLKISLNNEIQKIRNEIPTESDIKEKAIEVRGKEENKETEYEKVLKQKIDDLNDEREKVKKETKEKTNELKEDFKEKEKEFKDKIEEKEKDFKDKFQAFEKNTKSNQHQQLNPYNKDSWRYKSDITGTFMRGATSITKDVLNEAPVRKALNTWVRGTEGEGEEKETETVRDVEPKIAPLELPLDYVSEE